MDFVDFDVVMFFVIFVFVELISCKLLFILDTEVLTI